MMVSVTELGGFSGSVSMALTGLLSGATFFPSHPIKIVANSCATLTFAAPANTSTAGALAAAGAYLACPYVVGDRIGAPGGFDFAFFFPVLLPPAPFIPPHCRSTLNFPHSLLIT
jgi:hypothetical protein